MADFTAGLILVDPRTGSQTLLSPGSAVDVGIARNGDIYITSLRGLFRVDPTTGFRTLVASVASGQQFIKFDITPSGDFLVAAGNRLVLVNGETGAQSIFLDNISNLPGFSSASAHDVEIGPNGDTWFITSISSLYRVDAGTGIVHGPLFGIDSHPFGVDVGPKGDVFVVGADLAGIFHFDPATSSATKVGCIDTKCARSYEFSDVIQAPDGTLYGASNPGLDAAKVSRVDPITGIETIITSNGLLENPSGMALVVPEPPSIVLMGFGYGLVLVGIAYRRFWPWRVV